MHLFIGNYKTIGSQIKIQLMIKPRLLRRPLTPQPELLPQKPSHDPQTVL